jgi:hypothetical protein
MDCIICQDTGSEPLQENTSCTCKYKRHISCWIDYVHSRPKVICPLCRKDLAVKSTPKTKSTIHTPLRQAAPVQTTPYTPQLRTIPEENGRQITYQEFCEIVHQNNQQVQQNVVIQVNSTTQVTTNNNQTKANKLMKVVLGLCILAAVITLIWIFV